SSLNLWPSTIPENIIDELFPENLLVANTYDAYDFTMRKLENIFISSKRSQMHPEGY
ncbi:871_t:CDS:2, partial [Rhizophagus irregularis]